MSVPAWLSTSILSDTTPGGLPFEEDYELEDIEDDSTDSADPTDGPDKASKGLQAALAAERAKRQDVETRLAQIEADRIKAEEDRKQKAGEFEALYTGLKGEHEKAAAELAELRAEKQAHIEALTASNEERLAALSDDWKELVPDGLSPDKLDKMLTKIEARASASEERPAGGVQSKPPKKTSTHIPAEHLEQVTREAHKYGLDPKLYWSRHLKPRLERKKA